MLEDGKHHQCWRMCSVRACGEVNPSRWVSWVLHRYFYLTIGKVFEPAVCRLLERTTQEKAKRCVLYDVRVDFEHYVSNLQG